MSADEPSKHDPERDLLRRMLNTPPKPHKPKAKKKPKPEKKKPA